ncbi:MAG TPA: hypothetical protein PKG95_03865 [Anaerolineaceae bacterium]|nr:hypothetical protein [Anaerolineaceae bacterium]
MKNNFIRIEKIIYILVFILALLSRLNALGGNPLGDMEASLAIQATNLFANRATNISPEPAYLLLTGILFALFQATDFIARLIPALAGSLLVISPLILQRQLGRWPAIILAIGLALDPGLTAISRQAGGIIIGLTGTLFALGFYLKHSAPAFGVCLALALLGGPTLLPGWLALGIAILILRHHEIYRSTENGANGPFFWRNALIWTAGTLIIFGTLLFFRPQALSAAVASFVAYFQGWLTTSNTTLGQILLALLFYEFLPLGLGLIGGVRSLFKNDQLDRFLFLWWGLALGLVLVYPNRQVTDLAWAMVPLWAIAARQIARWIGNTREHRPIIAAQAFIVATLLTIVLVNLAVLITRPDLPQFSIVAHWVQLSAALLLIVATILAISIGWSNKTALDGMYWGGAVVALMLMIAAMWNASGRGNHPGRELWRIDAYSPQQDLLLDTLADVTDWGKVNRQPLDIYVVQGSPALQWLLMKDYPQTEFVTALPIEAKPAVVITDQAGALQLSAPYSGQDFIISTAPEWTAMLEKEWLAWGLYRRAPEYSTHIVMWCRTDLFPGSASDFTP